MAIVINGSGTVTGLSVGGLPDGTVDSDTLANNAVVTGKIADGTIANADINDLAASKLTGALPAISGASLTNLPAQGITVADHWRMNAGFTSPNDGVSYITQNWERPDTGGGGGYVGTGMSEAAGVWTFPSTGQYLIEFHIMASSNSDARYIRARIDTTTNNSSYVTASEGRGSLNPETSYWYTTIRASFLFDVTNVSTHKVKFSAGGITNNVSINGDSNGNETYVTFIRLGDT